MRTQVFFENGTAPSTRTPIVVNTSYTLPVTNGSYRIYSGDSVYLWTPPFPSETIIHTASKMTLDIWAGATPEMNIEASTATLGAGKNLSITLTTTEPNTLVYAVVAIDTPSIPVNVTGAGLIWYSRGISTNANSGSVYTYWAIASSILTSATITATVQGTAKSYDFALMGFVASGIDTINPFDSNLATAPATNNSGGGTPSVTFTTSGQNEFIIGAIYQNNKRDEPIVSGSTYTLIALANSKSMAAAIEYKDAANAGSQTVNFGATDQYWAVIGDALVPASTGGNISVSAFITDSTGTRKTTLIDNQTGNPTPQNGGQVATTFSIPAATISVGDYIEFVITAPTSCGIIVSWGYDKPTNIQLCTAYSSPV
ncbi:MAG TPA: hypothetical protein VLH35_06090 [Candidatus Acidoferrales bacterium]|nr:hypothetical protein [Candidatus Acidoferrales bacterium]